MSQLWLEMSKSKYILVAIVLTTSFLRLYKIDSVPVSLFGDELDVGYHAYSILKTARDYQGNFMPLHFQSLAEFRTPLYLYSAVPTVGLFGITPLGVRLPAAIFGIAGVWAIYLLAKEWFKSEKVALVGAAVLAFSPWHIQYSRAAFEVTEMLFFLMIGLYFFSRSLKNPKYLWLSMVSLALTPWIYSTAKLFTPALIGFLALIYYKELFAMPKKHLVRAIIALVAVGAPISYSVLFGGGAGRFSYVGVFSDPTIEPEVGFARQFDALARGDGGIGLTPTTADRFFHNKVVFWGDNILNNFFTTFSGDFLFTEGDINLRHSIDGIGQFYQVEAIPLFIGLGLLFTQVRDRKLKLLLIFWAIFGVIPAALTRDGGNHATRLILILPPLVMAIAYGLVKGIDVVPKIFRTPAVLVYLGVFIFGFVFYQHQYWVHNPRDSERWWHAGWRESIDFIKEVEGDYENVVISMRGEPAWIFFAGYFEFEPREWQENFPVGHDVELSGFGKPSNIGKYYFGIPDAGSVYDFGRVLGPETLYLATAKEVGVNLVKEPERTPGDVKLLKSVTYPSGEPAYYLFTGTSSERK